MNPAILWMETGELLDKIKTLRVKAGETYTTRIWLFENFFICIAKPFSPILINFFVILIYQFSMKSFNASIFPNFESLMKSEVKLWGQIMVKRGQIKVVAFLDIRLESWLDGSSSSILSIFAIFWTSEVISLGWIGTGWVLAVRGWIWVGTVGLFEFSGLVGLWWILVPYNGFSGSKSGR